MWTQVHRRTYERVGGRYPSDMTDGEWARLEPLIPPAKPGGRPRETDMREAIKRHFLSAAHGLPVALSSSRWISAPVDRLQHFPQFPEGWRVGRNLASIAHGFARRHGT